MPSPCDGRIAERSVEFYIHHDSVDVVVERSHGCNQCGQWHYLSGPIHTGSQQQGCGVWLAPSSRSVELDIEDETVSAESVDDVIDALTDALDEALVEDVDWIERAAPRWAAEHENADWEDRVAYRGTIFLDEAIIDGAREAGHQAVIDTLVLYGTCDSVDEARELMLSALSDAVTSVA